jgi:glycerol uptake facilitator-like aquaporin
MSSYQQPLLNPWQSQQQHVGLNYSMQGTSGRVYQWTSRLDIWKLLFEPFVTREQGRYYRDVNGQDIDIPFGEGPEMNESNKGSVLLGVRKMAISMFLELCCTFLMCVLVVGTVAGAFLAGANIVLIGILAGLTHAVARYAAVAARHTPHLPRALDPAFTWYSWWRGDFGAVIVALYLVAQYAGASLASLLLCHPGLHKSDVWSSVLQPKFGASPTDLSCFALWAYLTSALVITSFVHGFGQTFTSYRFSYAKRYVQTAGLQACTIFVLTQFYIHLGIFSAGNPLIYYTGFLAPGAATAVTGSWLDWGIPILWAPLAAGPIAAFFVWLLWNVSAKNRAEMEKGYKMDILREAGGMGGAQHTPEGRHEVMPPAGAATVTQGIQQPQSVAAPAQQQRGSSVEWLIKNHKQH